MFLGVYRHTVDGKGRLVLPARYRDRLEKGCAITKGRERCLDIYPMDIWDREVEKYQKLPRTDARVRRMIRAFFAGAVHQNLDAAGRVHLPALLRDYAGLGRQVVVTGSGELAEIWDPEAWKEYNEQADDYYANIEEALSEYGI